MKIDRIYLDDSLDNYLTMREVQCAVHLLSNKSSFEIASSLHLSKRTVENYLASIKEKLNCHKKPDLINKLSELNLEDVLTES